VAVTTVFTHDTEIALRAASALVNTIDGDQELLPDMAALDDFVREWKYSGTRRHDPAELRQVQELRPRLREIWAQDEDGVVRIVNDLLCSANALPYLVKHDEWDYHLHATPPNAPLATRMAVEAAMAFVDVVRGKELSRLQLCDYPTCDRVFVDLSKNRSKRFCDNVCANRAAVAAYRARNAR
jgi:hypothetical protein